MKLLHAPNSPYARKVRMAILEKGLTDRVTLVAANPAGADAASLRAANPLGKVPCLVLDDGAGLYDSPVICEYLNSLNASPNLIPQSGPARWTVLRIQALADGVMDAAVSARMETMRPDGQKSDEMIAHWRAGATRAIAQLDQEPHLKSSEFDLAHIATAAALGYVHFRLSDLAKSAIPSGLAKWWDKVQQRACVRDTSPAG